jgi:hypothetical protein
MKIRGADRMPNRRLDLERLSPESACGFAAPLADRLMREMRLRERLGKAKDPADRDRYARLIAELQKERPLVIA